MPDIEALVAEARLKHLDMTSITKEYVNPLAAKLADALEAQQAVAVAGMDLFGFIVTRSTAPRLDRLVKEAEPLGVALAALDAPPEGEGLAAAMPEVDYEKWAIDMCSLLDAIEIALSNDDYHGRAEVLVRGRFNMARKHGLTIHHMGQGAPTQ